MNELMTIKDNKVSAKSLYDFLELDKTSFGRWFNTNIIKNQFAEENIDYKVFGIHAENPAGGRPSKDAWLSIDFAKKLCMVSKSKRGEEARNYFIEVEKRYKNANYQLGSNQNDERLIRAKAMELNAKSRQSKLWLQIAAQASLPVYKQIATAYAANTLANKRVFELPIAEKRTYSATEIGELLGVSSNRIGILANRNKLKTDTYGALFLDKSRHSSKEVETFRYYENAIPIFRNLLGVQ